MSRGSDRSNVETLWLDTFGVLAGRVAHELKGALNGVVVNVEVVRSRSARPDATATAVHTFAESASTQLESVIAMTEALLALARPARRPLNVGQVVRSVEALVGAAARADDKRVETQGMIDALGTTSADPDVVRLVIASALIAATDAAAHVVCRGTPGGDAATICLECPGSDAAPSLEAAVLALAAAEGIDAHTDAAGLSITFPR